MMMMTTLSIYSNSLYRKMAFREGAQLQGHLGGGGRVS